MNKPIIVIIIFILAILWYRKSPSRRVTPTCAPIGKVCNNNCCAGNCTKGICTCEAGYGGSKCQYTTSMCNNNGTPADTDPLTCICDSNNISGPTCNQCENSPSKLSNTSISSATNGKVAIGIYKWGMGKVISYMFPNLAVDSLPFPGSLDNINYQLNINSNGKFTIKSASKGFMTVSDTSVSFGNSTPSQFTISYCGFLQYENCYVYMANSYQNPMLIPISQIESSGHYNQLLYLEKAPI